MRHANNARCFSDVDTPQPDEKSLICYISSLYDVFPEPPPIHPLYDPVSCRPPAISIEFLNSSFVVENPIKFFIERLSIFSVMMLGIYHKIIFCFFFI